MCVQNPCVVGHCLDTTHSDFVAGKVKMSEADRKELEEGIFDDEVCRCPGKNDGKIAMHSGKMCEKR